jgi:hypothetical protein
MLLFRLLTGVRLGERETLRLFAARGAFLYVVSALAVSHKTFTLTLSRAVPSDFGESREGRFRRALGFLDSPGACQCQSDATLCPPSIFAF